ncbi:FAD/NAD(P)-binding domain-containing protein [Candidatus Magnetomoraceae bacterium gMMP-15]
MHVAIIGSGPAGVNVVKTLRDNKCNYSITMFSAEDIPPYSPPALGEYVIHGNEDILFWEGRDFAEKYKVDARYGEEVISIMPEDKKLTTSKNETISFDYLVIASGSSLYSPVKGSDKKGVYDYKSFMGASSIKKIAEKTKDKLSALIVGGGFIGVEIALCLAKIGIKSALMNRRGWIMPRLLDPETAEYVEKDLQSQGVHVLLNTEGIEFAGASSVKYLAASDGRKLKADIYIAATGVKSNIDFVKDTDIECKYGIVVNKRLETKYPYIYACGDVAETTDLISGENTIHGLYPVAVSHAQTAAYNIMGQKRNYEPYINMNSLKKLNFKIIVAGTQDGEEIKVKDKNTLRKIFIKDNRIKGFVLLGDISNAGVYLSLLKRKLNISFFKDQLLSKNFNAGFLMS